VSPDGSHRAASFIGRTADLRHLSRYFDEKEGARLVTIHGEAGIGKSRLAQEFERLLVGRGIFAAWGRWYETPGMRPYVGFIEALRMLRATLESQGGRELVGRLVESEQRLLGARIRTEQAGLDPDGDSYTFFEAIVQPLLEAASAFPFLLVLDDFQWADEASIALLIHLARRSSEVTVPLALALWRDEEVAPGAHLFQAVDKLRRERLAIDMRLEGLSVEETGQLLISSLDRTPVEEAVHRLHGLTAGNPLFIREIVRHSAEVGRLGELLDPAPSFRWSVPGLPDTVQETISRRLRGLSDPIRGTLRVLSVLGREFEIGLLRSSGILTEEQLLNSVPEAMHLGFLMERRAGMNLRLAFSHPLVGAVLYRALDPMSRSSLHLRVAEALERARDESHESEIAHHLIEGQQPEDRPRALRYLVEAARRARAAQAQQEARRLWRQAFDLLDAGVGVNGSEKLLWAREFADTCSSAGHPDEALDIYRSLLRNLEPSGDPATVADLYGAIGWTLHIHGRRSEAPQYLERALPPPGAPATHRTASLLAAHAIGLLSSGQLLVGRPYLDRAMEIARGHPEIGADGLVYHLGAAWHAWDPGGDPSLVPQLIEDAERFFHAEGNEWSAIRLKMDAAVCLFCLGEISRFRQYLQAALEHSRRTGYTAVEADAWAMHAVNATLEGNWAAAEAGALRCEAYLQSVGSSLYGEALRRCQALRLCWQGRVAEARNEINKAKSFFVAFLEPHLRLAEGDREGATESIAAVAAMLPADGHGIVWLMFALSSASALCTLGRASEAARWYEALKHHAGWSMDWWQPEVELGRIAAGNRWWRQAFGHFEAAIQRYDEQDWRPFAAIARLEYAEARVRRGKPGDRQRAGRLLGEAMGAFEELGMALYMGRIRDLRRKVARGRPVRGLGEPGLTQRELMVLRLVADGLTNSEIAARLGMTRRTVESHVAHVLAKLDVANRAAAVARAAKEGLI
jgi:DNA-binding CsgD family transcriptional regulator